MKPGVSRRFVLGTLALVAGQSVLSRRVAAVSLWSTSGVCALMAVGVYQFADSYGSLLIAGFGGLWLLALVLFLRTPSQD